jgi:transcriptional regulator, HxlR family
VARNILTDRLRKLVDAGVFATQPASDGTAYQEYALTERGESLFPVVVALRQWGEQHLFAPGEPHSILIDSQSGEAIPTMLLQAADGHRLTAENTEVRKLQP